MSMSKRVLGLAAAAVLILGLAACVPTFPEESELSIVIDGSVLLLEWEEPTVANPETEPLRDYAIYVDGVEISRVDPIFVGCQLYGLDADTTYTIGVRAFDEANRGSEMLSAEILTEFSEEPFGEVECSTLPPL
jgi:hypothetical protein